MYYTVSLQKIKHRRTSARIFWDERMMRMSENVFYIPQGTPVMRRVRDKLLHCCVVADVPGNCVTHLVLGVPSLEADGSLKGGGPLAPVLETLPRNITIVGGNLDHPVLEKCRKIDLLKNERYLWENAAITAECAISLARQRMNRCWKDTSVLILGFGRIGFHLARTLKTLGASVTVAARKESTLAQAESLGLPAISFSVLDPAAFPVIFNTVPHMVLQEEMCKSCDSGCIKMDLASKPGIGGSGVIWARGLPGKYAPESSADLIVKTILREVSI